MNKTEKPFSLQDDKKTDKDKKDNRHLAQQSKQQPRQRKQ